MCVSVCGVCVYVCVPVCGCMRVTHQKHPLYRPFIQKHPLYRLFILITSTDLLSSGNNRIILDSLSLSLSLSLFSLHFFPLFFLLGPIPHPKQNYDWNYLDEPTTIWLYASQLRKLSCGLMDLSSLKFEVLLEILIYNLELPFAGLYLSNSG